KSPTGIRASTPTTQDGPRVADSNPAWSRFPLPACSRSWRIRCANHLVDLGARVRTVLEACSLGLLREEDFRIATAEVYRRDYDVYTPERPKVESMILPTIHQFTSGKRLLDVFCGSGREAGFFTQHGFAVTGVDSDEAMLAGARRYFEKNNLHAEF